MIHLSLSSDDGISLVLLLAFDADLNPTLDSFNKAASFLAIRQNSNFYSTTARHRPEPESLRRTDHVVPRRRRQQRGQNKTPNDQINHRSKRALGIYDVQSRRLQAYSLILPGQLAAEQIIEFFNTVYGMIELGAWSDLPATNYRLIRLGHFEMTFYSINAIIPFDFIQDYLIDKIPAVKHGFTACFWEHMTAIFNGAVAGVSVHLRLTSTTPPT
ncbi:hypothetical protein XPA_006350 [Xanthoria parietina]